MGRQNIYQMSFASIYPLYLAKVEKKWRSQVELDEIIIWLTGYSQARLIAQIEDQVDLEAFFSQAPQLNPLRFLITGVICGVRVEEIKEPLMREIRYLDKLVDELAKGKKMEKILRQAKQEPDQ